MKFLLDTNIFIWFTQGDEKLTDKDRGIIEKNSNEIFLSLVSVWEIAIKYSLGKLEIQRPFKDYIPGILIKNNIQTLDLNFTHIDKMTRLPFYHKDPFDRLIIAQSIVERMTLLYSDSSFKLYPLIN
jgi:PIN domain nuclease of toxin-antitoxin system